MKNQINNSFAGFLIAALVVVSMVTSASATVTTFAWYRGGEADPGAVNGGTVPTAVDSAASENLTTSGGSPTWTTAQLAPSSLTPLGASLFAYDFDAADNDTLHNSTSGFGGVVDNFGIETWVRYEGGTAGGFNSTVPIFVLGLGANQYGLTYLPATSEFGAVINGTPSIGAGVANSPLNTWVHLALVKDAAFGGGDARFYVNGVFMGGAPYVSAGRSSYTLLGTEAAGGWLSGQVDEARIFTFAAGAFNPLTDLNFDVVPEPSVAALLILGGGLLTRRLRRRS